MRKIVSVAAIAVVAAAMGACTPREERAAAAPFWAVQRAP